MESEQDEDDLAETLKAARVELISHIKSITVGSSKYDVWKNHLINFDGSDWDACLLAKKIEILIYRDINKQQLALEFSLTMEELLEKADEKISTAARLFLSLIHI